MDGLLVAIYLEYPANMNTRYSPFIELATKVCHSWVIAWYGESCTNFGVTRGLEEFQLVKLWFLNCQTRVRRWRYIGTDETMDVY